MIMSDDLNKALPIGLHGASVLGIDPMETADSVFKAEPIFDEPQENNKVKEEKHNGR